MAKGMGFAGATAAISAKQGIPKAQAAAILAAQTRKASPAAKRKNPNLKKVLMPKKGGKPTRAPGTRGRGGLGATGKSKS
jgi:uncharacterized protein GlcG (DUF336 family)